MASDHSLSLAQITHLGSDLSLALIMIIAPVTRLRNKMTDIVNDVFRCIYATIDVFMQTQDTK